MEKYNIILLAFLLGAVLGVFGLSFTKNMNQINPRTSSSFITVTSENFIKNPRIHDVYFLNDLCDPIRTALIIVDITKDFIKLADVTMDLAKDINVEEEMIMAHLASSRTHEKLIGQPHYSKELKYIPTNDPSAHIIWSEGKLLTVYRTYSRTNVVSSLNTLSSPISIFIILICFLAIWFGTETGDFVGQYDTLFPKWLHIIFLIFVFYLFNSIYFSYQIFAILFSVCSILPIYLFFQKAKYFFFKNHSWLIREVYKFTLLVLFGILFQMLFYIIFIFSSFVLSEDPFAYIMNISDIVGNGTVLLWVFIATGNFLNNTRKYLVESRQKEKKAQLKAQQSKAQLDALQAKVNPHFLYNSLNSIAGLAQESPAKTEEMAIALSHFYKQSTNRQGEHWNTIGEAIELLQTYLEIEKIRFGKRLQFDLLCSEELKEEKIPRFLLQPLVENAIKYGYQSETNSIQIRLAIAKEDNQLVIRIFDTGQAFPDNLQSGYGVQSVQKKLELLYPDRHELAFINAPEKQVRITLK